MLDAAQFRVFNGDIAQVRNDGSTEGDVANHEEKSTFTPLDADTSKKRKLCATPGLNLSLPLAQESMQGKDE